MPNLRPVPISENPHSSWQNLVQRTVQAQSVVAGSGVTVTNHGDFTKVGLPTDVDFERLVWRGDFDEFAEYRINDVIRVIPNVPYIDVTTGEDLVIGSTSDEGQPYAPLSLGLFVCVNYVPPAWANQDYFYNQIVPAYDTIVPYELQTGIRWDDYNYYYPMYPEIPTSLTSSVNTGYGFTITANQTFWQAMPFGTMPLQICTNGLSRTFYVVGGESGSLFKTEYLPYS